jgi:heterodisulfide reductase subunit C
MKGQNQSYNVKEKTEMNFWDEINRQPQELSSDEIITLYYRLRDAHSISGGEVCYHNIQHLHATPFEREKDRREQKQWIQDKKFLPDVVEWYREARDKSCIWWLENHVIAKHSFSNCMSCGVCTALCPAAEFYDFNPREMMTLVQEKNEEEIIGFLKSEKLWYCHQCGSCKTKCPRRNSPFGMISSLRLLSQLKGYHIESVRGRQQYFARHLWGGNLWNRACTLYFRNPLPDSHQDFGPRFETYFHQKEEFMKRVGAHPDMDGPYAGRKVHSATLDELRRLWFAGGALFLWSLIEEAAQKQAQDMNLSIDEYHLKVKTEG